MHIWVFTLCQHCISPCLISTGSEWDIKYNFMWGKYFWYRNRSRLLILSFLFFNWFAVDWENDILFWPSFYLFYWVLQWYITKNQHLKNNPACNTQFNLKNAVKMLLPKSLNIMDWLLWARMSTRHIIRMIIYSI